MKTTVTKFFRFSASHSSGSRIFGKNYILEITLDAVSSDREDVLEEKVSESLIRKLESRDLGLHVDFLKGIEITDGNLLKTFWSVLQKTLPGFKIRSMTLQRDETTKTTLIL